METRSKGWFPSLLVAGSFALACDETECSDNPCTGQETTIRFAEPLTDKGGYDLSAVFEDGTKIDCHVELTDDTLVADGTCDQANGWIALEPLDEKLDDGAAVLGPESKAAGIDSFGIASLVAPTKVTVKRDDVTVVDTTEVNVKERNSKPEECGGPCISYEVVIPSTT